VGILVDPRPSRAPFVCRQRSSGFPKRSPPARSHPAISLEEFIMFAVIATGGKQYKVAVGDEIDVEKLDTAVEGSVDLRPIMLVDDDDNVTVGADNLSGATVTATVVDQYLGEKVRIFKYKNKTGYRRKTGHRQPLTRVRVETISK
jgi:large subunit ribosomal protein L21